MRFEFDRQKAGIAELKGSSWREKGADQGSRKAAFRL